VHAGSAEQRVIRREIGLLAGGCRPRRRGRSTGLGWVLAFALFLLNGACLAAGAADEPAGFKVHPIGHVRAGAEGVVLELDEKYLPGLLGLEGFSHVWVIWWFDRTDSPAQRGILQVHPRRDPRNPLSGVFSTRAPVRPNPIALTLCRILSVRGNRVEVDAIDAFDGTPILDLKPYIPGWESRPDALTPQRF